MNKPGKKFLVAAPGGIESALAHQCHCALALLARSSTIGTVAGRDGARRTSARAWRNSVNQIYTAFSHMALVKSAYNLTRATKPVEQRAQAEYQPPEKATAE